MRAQRMVVAVEWTADRGLSAGVRAVVLEIVARLLVCCGCPLAGVRATDVTAQWERVCARDR